MESWQTLFLVADLAQRHLNALDVGAHGGLRVRRLVVATIHGMSTGILSAAVSGVRDGGPERPLGVDHFSPRGSGGARRGPGGHVIASAMSHSDRTLGGEKLTKSLRCLPQVSYRRRRFATSRAKERGEGLIGIAKDRAK